MTLLKILRFRPVFVGTEDFDLVQWPLIELDSRIVEVSVTSPVPDIVSSMVILRSTGGCQVPRSLILSCIPRRCGSWEVLRPSSAAAAAVAVAVAVGAGELFWLEDKVGKDEDKISPRVYSGESYERRWYGLAQRRVSATEISWSAV